MEIPYINGLFKGRVGDIMENTDSTEMLKEDMRALRKTVSCGTMSCCIFAIL